MDKCCRSDHRELTAERPRVKWSGVPIMKYSERKVTSFLPMWQLGDLQEGLRDRCQDPLWELAVGRSFFSHSSERSCLCPVTWVSQMAYYSLLLWATTSPPSLSIRFFGRSHIATPTWVPSCTSDKANIPEPLPFSADGDRMLKEQRHLQQRGWTERGKGISLMCPSSHWQILAECVKTESTNLFQIWDQSDNFPIKYFIA